MEGWREQSGQIRSRRNTNSENLVQPRGRSAEAAAAGSASRHQAAGRPRRSRTVVPDGADPAGGVGGAHHRHPGADPRRLPHVAADAAHPRAPAGTGAANAGQDLFQVRRRLAGGLAQAQYRGAAGLVQQGAGHQAALHRDRRRPVGLGARFCRRAVRHRRDRVPGPRVLRSKTLSPGADGDLWRALHRLAVERDGFRPRHPRQGPEKSGLARYRHFRGCGGGRQGSGGEIFARLRAQPCAAAPDRQRPGSDQAIRDGGRRPRHRDRLHRRRLELRGACLPVPRAATARWSQAPLHRGRAGGVPVAHPRPVRL